MKEIKIYPTTDGHEFRKMSDALIWQSVLNYNSVLSYKEEIVGIGQIQLTLDNPSEIEALYTYLTLYHKFDTRDTCEKLLREGYSGMVVQYDREDKVLEVVSDEN